MKLTKRHLRRIITEEIRDLVDGTPLFITDMGRSMKITSGDAAEELDYDSIPRYAVWGYHASKGKPQVIDGSDDVQELLQRHGEHLKVTKLNESRNLTEAVEPQKLYDRMQELHNKYGTLWFALESVGPKAKWGRKLSDDDYEEMLAARNEYFEEQGPVGYSDFFFDSRVSGNDPKKRKMNPMHLKTHVYEKGFPLEEIKAAWEEYSELKPKFKTFDATDMTDSMYGRKRRNIAYIHDDGTEEVISSTTDRAGSLGT